MSLLNNTSMREHVLLLAALGGALAIGGCRATPEVEPVVSFATITLLFDS